MACTVTHYKSFAKYADVRERISGLQGKSLALGKESLTMSKRLLTWMIAPGLVIVSSLE